MMKTLAQIGYEAYVRSCGGTAFNGDPLPEWPDLKPEIQGHWAQAAAAIKDEIERS